MKNLIYIVFAFLIVMGCKPGIPSDIIQPDDMSLILHDIHVADGLISTIPYPDSSKIIAASYYNGIYKKYNVDSALYNRSMAYYFENPRTLDGIYDKVISALNKQKAVIVKADSIVAAKAAKIQKAKMKADSTRLADSLKKISAPIKAKQKADSIKKALAVKKADSVKNAKAMLKKKRTLLKERQKKRRDSIRQKALLDKNKLKK